MVNITINGKAMAVKNGTTIMEAATQLGIPIPHLLPGAGRKSGKKDF